MGPKLPLSNHARVSRREALATGIGLAIAGGAGASFAASIKPPSALAASFEDPDWNLRTLARLEGDSDPRKQIHGFNTGTVCGVRDGEAVRPLFGFEVFSSIRLVPQPNGTIQRLCRELVFYRDLATGELLDQWKNAYTGETVRVVDVANDPYSYLLTTKGADTGKNSVHAAPASRAQRWYMLNENTVAFDRDVHLYYPSLLTPDKWPRESPGPMVRASEFLRYSIRLEDLQNARLNHLPHTGTWARVTPWLPWMLMDGAPGHCVYVGMFTTRRDVSQFSPAVLARVTERYPKYLSAPTEWTEPSYSSLENYTRTEKPAVKPK